MEMQIKEAITTFWNHLEKNSFTHNIRMTSTTTDDEKLSFQTIFYEVMEMIFSFFYTKKNTATPVKGFHLHELIWMSFHYQ